MKQSKRRHVNILTWMNLTIRLRTFGLIIMRNDQALGGLFGDLLLHEDDVH